ncbi:MAG TPA: indole-3-glycerol phosphate synthase TrpC [Longimicrobiales bacterium]|nr:indole-3-glycerol phosphate synthase TrpC [Longimicrobiales bacterium]
MNRSARVVSVLDDIVAAKRGAAARLRLAEVQAIAADAPPARDFGGALRDAGVVRVIAEFKRRSPSAGWIREDADAALTGRGYAVSGAAAISVLTDREWFGGSLDDLGAIRAAVDVPVLRKDFVVAAAQIWEARAAGADAVLLIVRILDDALLGDLLATAGDAGVAALVEVHDEAELERALGAGARIVGVNNRDLSVFRTDLAVSERLAARVPADVVLVGESGIGSPADVERLGRAGVDAVLMGETLMRAPDPAGALRAFTACPRDRGARR